MYNYFLYNLRFISDIILFNIPQSDTIFTDWDVAIHAGSINTDIMADNQTIYFNKNLAIMKVKYGILCINSGKEIIYSIQEGYRSESITPFIMGWGLAFILTQKGYSAFHCSALIYNDQCFFVSGVSGAGKSTTALELIKHGCAYLCDDMAIVNSYKNMMVPPAFPVQKVCSTQKATLDNNSLHAINNDRGKYCFLNTTDYCDTPKQLTTIFKLLVDDIPNIEIKEITGIDKYLKVLECLFLELQYALSSFPDDEKFRCLKIAGNIRFFTIVRPKGKDTVKELANSIFKILNEQGACNHGCNLGNNPKTI